MSIIHVLPENVSNKIAAGEVIERPASVVKELVENALDAGASRIIVNIEQGGLRLISVTDDGSGMDADDALLCLEAHATSKIATDNDINRIITFGFRGEAVPSIASVSRFTLRTRRHDDVSGTEVVVHGGRHLSAGPAGCAPGTEIAIRDLFFNTPARKKFLRSRATEDAHIQESLMLLSLPHPHVSFELIMDGRRIFHSPGHDTLLPRLQTYFGKELADHLLPVSYQDEELKIGGYIARHGFTRTTRREQRVFVNGRPVEALPVYNGLRDGYGSLVEKGRYAPAVLFIHLDPALVDVNVHPAKREVRFRRPRHITQAVTAAVSDALKHSAAPTVSVDRALSLRAVLDGATVGYLPQSESLTFDFNDDVPMPSLPPRPRYPDPRPVPFVTLPEDSDAVPEPAASAPAQETPDAADMTRYETAQTPEATPPETPVAAERETGPSLHALGTVRALGIIGQCYIVAEVDNGLLLVDQHAAHERVLYEQLLSGGDAAASQRLLLPLPLELARTEVILLERYRDNLEKLGFDLEPVGNTTIMINALPASLHQNNAGNVIRDLVSELRDNEAASRTDGLSLIARAACRAAVKAHDPLTENEAVALLHQLGACELPFSCPHGRPTIINVSYRELERRFGRR